MTKPLVTFVSATALALALGQTVWSASAIAADSAPAAQTATPAAQTTPAPAAQTAAPAPAAQTIAPAPTSPADMARANADARRAAMDKQRQQRYAELRARAAEIGVDLPETPPWEAAMTEADNAMRQWRDEMRERMRSMTPEERKAMHDDFWQKRRAEAAERGVDLPEMPAWDDIEKRHEQMQQRFEGYRKIVDQMTDEQREAAQAIGRALPIRALNSATDIFMRPLSGLCGSWMTTVPSARS